MIYLQRYAESGQIGKEESTVMRHAIMERLPYRFIDENSLGDKGLYTDLSLFVGSVEGCRVVLESLGQTLPEPNYYPLELSKYLGRKVWLGKSADVLMSIVDSKSIFAKPSNKWKLFTGQLFNESSGYQIIKNIAPDEDLWLSEPITFVSEFRAYVVDAELISVSQYAGEDDAIPNTELIKEAISEFALNEKNPKTYAFDWGFTEHGRFLLVEVNHGFAIGKYPDISDKDYFRFIESGWHQLVKN